MKNETDAKISLIHYIFNIVNNQKFYQLIIFFSTFDFSENSYLVIDSV